MKLLILVTSVLVVCSAQSDEGSWKLFKEKYGKSFDEIEDKVRFTVFQRNLRKIEQHNKQFEDGRVSYMLGITKFSDLSQEEFIGRLENSIAYDNKRAEFAISHKDAEVPERMDWRERDTVSPVRDQGSCDGSFYFAALGTLESHNYILNGIMVNLSEQFMIDCSLGFNNGCNGGGVINTFDYIRNNGVAYEKDYPYEGTQGDCNRNISETVFKTIGYVVLPTSEEIVKKYVATVGPITVSFDGTNLRLYSDGIYNDPSCDSSKSNQSGVIVGYDTYSDGTDYWIVKMSWGSDWGEDGYVRIARNADNNCGIVSDAIYPTL